MRYPENRALQAAVIADAEEDAPRLVYADWLDEHGDPERAEYIRNQCALADRSPADPDYADLSERKPELLAALFHRREELAPKLPNAVHFHNNLYQGDDDTYASYHRGFPYFAREPESDYDDPVGLPQARAFAKALPEVITTTTLRGLRLFDWSDEALQEVLTSPAAGRLSALALHVAPEREDASGGWVETILSSPAAPNLRWLDLGGLVSTADVDRLAGARVLGRLRRLHAPLPDCGPAARRRLRAAEWFGRLRRVATGFEAEGGAAWVAGLAKLPELHTLEVDYPSAQAVAALAGPRRFPALGGLFLRHGRLHGDGAAALARARLPALAALEVYSCGLRNDDMATLARSPLFERLTVLSLVGNEVGDKGVAAVAASPCASSLRVLRLGANRFGGRGLVALAKQGAFPSLTTLDLHSGFQYKVAGADVTRFLAGLSLPRLRRLDLQGWDVDDAGAKALATNPTFARLTSLNINAYKGGRKATAALLTSPNLQGLIKLEVRPAEAKAVEALKDRAVLPHLRLCQLPEWMGKLKARLRAARPEVTWF